MSQPALTRRAFDTYDADGVWEPWERRNMRALLSAADLARAVGEYVNRAPETERYLDRMVGACKLAFAELPDPEAA